MLLVILETNGVPLSTLLTAIGDGSIGSLAVYTNFSGLEQRSTNRPIDIIADCAVTSEKSVPSDVCDLREAPQIVDHLIQGLDVVTGS